VQAAGGASPFARLTSSPLAMITTVVVAIGALALVVAVGANVLASASGPQPVVAPAQPAPAGLASGRSIGKSTAPVKLDVWEDFQCPYCDEFTRSVEPSIVSQYVAPGTAQLTFHDYSFIGNGHSPDESNDAAVAARCAEDQGQFWAYMQYLYANQGASENSGTFNKTMFDAIATKLGLNLGTFDSCLSDPAKLQAVRAETAQGQQLGITGTPTLFVDGKALANPQDINAVSSAIEAAAQGKTIPGTMSLNPATPTPSPS
jgi:protein-disulfide isomerase